MKLKYICSIDDSGKDVRHILKTKLNISSNLIIRLKNDKMIFCNDIPVFTNHKLQENDIVEAIIEFDESEQNDIVATNVPLTILFEDEYLLVVDKPANMPTHPCMNHYDTTISNAVKYYYDTHNIRCLIRPVIRLDKDTSGIVVFAKNPYIQECLIKQMKEKSFKKQYLALVENYVITDSETLKFRIARKTDSIIERCVSESGESAITHYSVIKRFNILEKEFTFIELDLETGRTHQIRVHISHIGHPIVGDTLYGNSSEYINRQALHCYKLIFNHPITNEQLIIESNIPNDINEVLKKQNTQL